MPRRLKDLEVGEGVFRDGSRFKVFYDRNDDEFFADVLGERVEGPTEAKCKSNAVERWGHRSEIEWRRILVVSTNDNFRSDDDGSLHFSFEVCEVGQETTSGRWLTRSEETGRVYKYHGETETDAERGTYVLPWSPDLESACVDIASRITQLRQRLRKMLGNPDAVTVLSAWASKLLPPGDDG